MSPHATGGRHKKTKNNNNIMIYIDKGLNINLYNFTSASIYTKSLSNRESNKYPSHNRKPNPFLFNRSLHHPKWANFITSETTMLP